MMGWGFGSTDTYLPLHVRIITLMSIYLLAVDLVHIDVSVRLI